MNASNDETGDSYDEETLIFRNGYEKYYKNMFESCPCTIRNVSKKIKRDAASGRYIPVYSVRAACYEIIDSITGDIVRRLYNYIDAMRTTASYNARGTT
jgi:hypothetical protein